MSTEENPKGIRTCEVCGKMYHGRLVAICNECKQLITPELKAKAVAMLASGQTVTETAKELNLQPKTVKDWKPREITHPVRDVDSPRETELKKTNSEILAIGIEVAADELQVVLSPGQLSFLETPQKERVLVALERIKSYIEQTISEVTKL